MTQVMTRPPAEPGPDSTRGRPRVRRPAGDRLPDRSATQFAAEVSLTLVTAAAVVGMHRLFVDGTYRPALLVQALAAHVVVALLRRARVSLPLAGLASVLAGLLALTWGHYLDTTAALLPTGQTVSAAGDDLSAAWRLFQDVQAPAPVDTGFLLAAGAAVWVMVFVADWAAFRASATFEALLPSATLFLFAAALGAPGGRVAGATVYAAAAMLFVLIRRTLEQEATAAWAATHRSRGRWSLLGTGLVLVAVAVAAGAIAGPKLPGADDDAVIAWRDFGDTTEPRIVVSPMVDIQARMLDQPEVELFTVRSDRRAYWRLTSLDKFDGEIWKSSYGTSDADGELPQAVETDLPISEVEQTYEVSRLARVWLPAAYEPMAISAEGGEVDWDPDSSTLIVDKDESSSDGLTYQVTSDVPRWSESELRTATGEMPAGVRSRYLELPEGFNPGVRDLAEQVVGAAATPYDKARALQEYLKAGDFTYDLNVPGGHSEDALSTFLFDTKRGYCEQFAGSFAAMARSVDLPTRVAVGFTYGILGDDGLYHVRGEHAHAWVEVYMQGFGWIPFDPTPGRAPPSGEQWMGYAEQQDQAGGDGETPTAPEVAAVTVPTTPPGQPPEATGDTRSRNDDGVAMTGGDDEGGGSPIGDALRALALAALALAAAYLVIVPLALVAHHVLRRRRASTPAARVRLAWTDTVERADAAVVALPPSLTVGEVAGRLTHELPQVAPAVGALSGLVERTAYAEVEPSPEEADGAERARGEIVAAADRLLSTRRRILRHADVRELWRRHTPHRRRSAHTGPLSASTN